MHRLERLYGNADGLANWDKVAEIELQVPALLAHMASCGDLELLVFDGERLSYREAASQSALLARQLLAAGAGKGTRVGMWFPSNARFIVAWLAITRIGAIAVPISTLATGLELRRIAMHSDLHILVSTDRYLHHDYIDRIETAFPELKEGARVPFRFREAPYLRRIWVWGANQPAWAESVDLSRKTEFNKALLTAVEHQVSPADIASIIYSSGSTAEPKGIMQTHGALLREGCKVAANYPFVGNDRVFTPMPYFWIGGLVTALLNVILTRSTLLNSELTGSALLDFLEQERASYIWGWPHLMKKLAADPTLPGRNFSALRGGGLVEALPPEKRPKNQAFGNALGMTETCSLHTLSPPDLPDHLRGSSGPPMFGMEHKIVDVDTRKELGPDEIGELLVRGDTLSVGFVKRERSEIFDADGWYPTGDLCSFHEGQVFFHGRADDMIKTSGVNVSPREVEAALGLIPGVAQVFATGIPDEIRVAVVGTIVVPHPGAVLDAAQIRRDLAKSLAAYKVPRVILVIEATKLPILSSSKLDRRALIQMLIQAHQEAQAAG